MKVSVVIPLYNKARHIRRAVDSVKKQSIQDFELLVVDDGSTDGGAEIVDKIVDPRIRVVRQQNCGECAARNAGIKEASSPLVAFLDADDEYLPCFLETVLGLHDRYPEAGIYATSYRRFDGASSVTPRFEGSPSAEDGGLLADYFRAGFGLPPVTSSSVMIPKVILQQIGGFPCGVRRGGDLATWAKIALYHPVAWSPRVCAVYHLEADNRACRKFLPPADAPGAPDIERMLSTSGRIAASRESIAEYLAHLRLSLGKEHCILGDKRIAAEMLRKTRATAAFTRDRRKLKLMVLVPSVFLRYLLVLWVKWRSISRKKPHYTGAS